MSELNVRISALKLSASVKNSSDGSVRIPSKWENSKSEFLQKFLKASDADTQRGVIKEIFQNATGESEALLFLADLLFSCPLKHSSRNLLMKLFSDKSLESMLVLKKDNILAALGESLSYISISMNKHIQENVNLLDDELNELIVSVDGVLHNFPYGREALHNNVMLFIPILSEIVKRYWNIICTSSTDLSHTERNDYYLYIHSALRFHVALISDCKQLKPSECGKLRELTVVAQNIAQTWDTPWDVRALAGLSIGHNARFFNEFPKHLNDCSLLCDVKEITIQAAVLLLLKPNEYEVYANKMVFILKVLQDYVLKNKSVNMQVYLSKHLHNFSKILRNSQRQDHPLIIPTSIINTLVNFAMSYLNTNVEAVRYNCAEMLLNTLKMANMAGVDDVFPYIFKKFNSGDVQLTAGCIILEQIVAVAGARIVIDNCPSLQRVIFPNYLGRNDPVDSLFKSMVKVSANQFKAPEFHKLWGKQLISIAKLRDERLVPIERIVTECVRFFPIESKKLIKDPNLPFSTKLTTLLMMRRMGQLPEIQTQLEQFETDLYNAMIGVDDHTRLLALRFVVESEKPSDPLGTIELKAVANFLQYNANGLNPHTRQIAYDLIRKLIKRLELVLVQLKKPNISKDQHNYAKGIEEFFGFLMSTAAWNLFPTGNYGRRWISLRLLYECLDLCYRLPLDVASSKMPPQIVHFLEDCLHDSYEFNKEMAISTLQLLNKMNLLPIDARMGERPGQIMKMLLSVRPPDSLTGAYQLQYYCLCTKNPNILEDFELTCTELPIYEPTIYAALKWCMAELQRGIEIGRKSISNAAKLNPMYGLLFVLRHLIQTFDMESMAKERLWQTFISHLVIVSINVCEIVLPVVASLSPEGYLPEDCAPHSPQSGHKKMSRVELENLKVTPQMILLCSWRCIKEIALLFGHLAEKAPILEGADEDNGHIDQPYLLTRTQIIAMGEHFRVLLSEIKHRGAFEQAYVGFSMLCKRFWQSGDNKLSNLPRVWILESVQMLNIFDPEDKLDSAEQLVAAVAEAASTPSLYAFSFPLQLVETSPTRRSAGIPFMLQALICTELQVGTSYSFHHIINMMFNVCERRRPDEVAARTHAMNVLRALFRCSELADMVSDYVSRAVMCSFKGLLAKEWCERNSATLLFSALMVRIFGVERCRDMNGTLNIRNRMTGRIFFMRYPELYDFFFQGLRNATFNIYSKAKGGGQLLQLEAMMLMLSRLYPSPHEGQEHNLDVAKFLPFVSILCSSYDVMARDRAALVMTNLVSETKAAMQMRKVLLNVCLLHMTVDNCDSWENPNILNWNVLHSYNLQLLTLYKMVKWNHVELITMLVRGLSVVAMQTFDENIFVYSSALNVLTEILSDVGGQNVLAPGLMDTLITVYEANQQVIFACCAQFTVSPRFFHRFSLMLHSVINKANVIMQYMLNDFLEQNPLPVGVQEFKIDLWVYLLFNHKPWAYGLVDEVDFEYYGFDTFVVRFFDRLSEKTRADLSYEVHTSTSIYLHLLAMADSDPDNDEIDWYPQLKCKIYAAIAMCRDMDLTMNDLLKSHATSKKIVQPGLLLCILRLLVCNPLKNEELLPVLLYALEMCQPMQTAYVRYKVAQLSSHLLSFVKDIVATKNVDLIGYFMRLHLLLLTDENVRVRNYVAESVAKSIIAAGEMCELDNMKLNQSKILPTLALPHFLRYVLHLMYSIKPNSAFMLRLFNLISHPFTMMKKVVPEKNPLKCLVNDNDISNMYDPNEENVYCEPVSVTSEIMKIFRDMYPNLKELNEALAAMEEFCAYRNCAFLPLAIIKP